MSDDTLFTNLANLQKLIRGAASSQSMAVLNSVMTDTIGMSMHNAVSTQHNAQLLNSAATTSTCVQILSVMAVRPVVPITTTPDTVVSPLTTVVTPLAKVNPSVNNNDDPGTSITNEANMQAQTSEAGKILSTEGSAQNTGETTQNTEEVNQNTDETIQNTGEINPNTGEAG